MISLKNSISDTTLSATVSATTPSITASTSGGRGTYTYLWSQSGTTCTITSSTSASTTFTGSGVAGTTTVYCAIKDTVTGNILNTDVCTISWITSVTGSITQGSTLTGIDMPCTANLLGAVATGYTWARVSGIACTFNPNGAANTTVRVPSGTTIGTSTIVQCTITYSGGSVVPTTIITWGQA